MRHIDAWMDRVALSSLGRVNINQVTEEAPALDIVTDERPGRAGQRLTARKRQSLKVTLDIVIFERFDLDLRAQIATQIAAWAHGSYLELSNHPDQRLRVVCTSVPTVGEARNPASTLKVEFTAYTVPFWENKLPTTLMLSGASGDDSLFNAGTAVAPVNLTIKPTDGTLTDLTVNADGSTVTLTGLSVQQGDSLVFSRDHRDDLMISCNSVSLLSKRTASSADDLLVSAGIVSVSFTANVACDVQFACCGRWL